MNRLWTYKINALWVFLGILLLSTVIGLYLVNPKNILTDNSKVEPSIAVLPFLDMSEGKDQVYFGEGISEEILNALAQLTELKVAGRTSSFSFKNKEVTIEEIGKILKVNYVLEGSIQKQGDKIRITAQLIKVADGYHLWSNKYIRDFEDVFAIQEEVAQKIATILLKQLAPEQLSKLKIRPAENHIAYDLFLQAKHIHLNKYYGNYNINDFVLSEKLFLKAIELDSNYALAYAGLADLYDSHKDALSDKLALRHYDFLKIKHIEKAWQLNPNLSYVNIVRGWVMRNKKVEPNDLDAAYQSFLRGYQLNPTNPDGLFGLAFLYEDKSLFLDADKLLNKAIEIDPLRSANYSVKGDFLMRAGKYDQAIEANLEALAINPTDLYALSQLALNYAFLKKKEKVRTIYQQIEQIDEAYLNRSVIDKKLYALVNGDTNTALNLPTSLLDYRGENVIISSLIGEENALEIHFLKWWDWWQKFKGEKVFSQSSAYIELLNNPMYAPLINKTWFREILQKEREKYNHFYKEYARAEEILINHQPNKVIADAKGSSNVATLILISNKVLVVLKKYYLYFIVLIISILGYFLRFKNYQKKQDFPKEKQPSKAIPNNQSIAAIFLEDDQKRTDAFGSFLKQRTENPDTKFLQEVIKYILEDIDNSTLGAAYLSHKLHLSESQIYRKLKTISGKSTALFIRSVRLQKAIELLQTTNKTISEITYEIGFNDPAWFSRAFKEEFGMTPSETQRLKKD